MQPAHLHYLRCHNLPASGMRLRGNPHHHKHDESRPSKTERSGQRGKMKNGRCVINSGMAKFCMLTNVTVGML
jgi:hypothetical protein